MEKQIGSLPLTGKIELTIDENLLSMLNRNLIPGLIIEGILSYPHTELVGKKKIKIKLLKAYGPEQCTSKTETIRSNSNALKKEEVSGLSRAENYLIDHILVPSSWHLFGHLEGSNPIPIVIFFSKLLGFGTYSLKKESESREVFNPQLN